MRDVSFRVVLVVAVISAIFACTATGQVASKTKTKTSDFDRLDPTQLTDALTRLGMHELKRQFFKDSKLDQVTSLNGMLLRVGLEADAMQQIRDPAERLAAGKKIIALLEAAVDKAEKEAETAEEAAENASAKTKTDKLLAASKSSCTYLDILYRLGDMAGRQAIEPYAQKLMYLQDNREDRRIILESTDNAVMFLQDTQDGLKKNLRDWHEDMSVWMIMGARGETLLREAQYRSSWAYLYRALALGDAEAHESEREGLKGKDLAKLAADQKRRTAQRRDLLHRILAVASKFEKNKRWGVTHEARRLMAIAHRELGQYGKAIDKLAPKRYEGASGATRMTVAMELPITLVKKGEYSEAEKAIGAFKGYAEMVMGQGTLTEIQQAQVDLKVALLKDYLYRRQAATATTPADKAKYRAAGQAAMVEFLNKYETEGIRRSFIDFFGNRLVYAENLDELSSVQLYIIANGAAARKELDRRRMMLEKILTRKDDPSAKKLMPEIHWQLGMAMNDLKRNIDAADNFIAVVKLLDPDNPRSPRAAQNASICMDKYDRWYRANKKKNIRKPVRLKCAEAMTHAVSFDNEKNAALKLSQWYYPLGRHCAKLSESASAKEAAVWTKRAAEAFSKVPPKPPEEYFSAQDLWLDLRYRALMRGKMDARAMAAAVKLREDYGQFAQRIEKYIAGLADKTSDWARQLTQAAAWADFTRAKLLSEQMRQESVGLIEVETLLKKWSKVDSVVVAASQWKIQNLVDQDKIEEASNALEAFLKANKKTGAGLIQQVIEGIRKAIDKAETKGGNAAKLASLRKSYLQLADRLYAPIRGEPIEIRGTVDNERLNLTQLWIDALVQNDKAADAMKLALECRRIFDKRRADQAKKIDEKYAKVIRDCKAAIGLLKPMKKLVKDYNDELVRLSKAPDGGDFDPKQDAKSVNMAYKALISAIAKGADPGTIKRLMAAVSDGLVTGYKEIIRRLKRNIPIELTVEWNVAKCLAATGKYGDSLLIYLRLIKGTDPRADEGSKRRFWRLQLEYCQTYISALGKDKERMGKLVAYIETELPKMGGDSLGGFKAEFFALKERARSLSQ